MIPGATHRKLNIPNYFFSLGIDIKSGLFTWLVKISLIWGSPAEYIFFERCYFCFKFHHVLRVTVIVMISVMKWYWYKSVVDIGSGTNNDNANCGDSNRPNPEQCNALHASAHSYVSIYKFNNAEDSQIVFWLTLSMSFCVPNTYIFAYNLN